MMKQQEQVREFHTLFDRPRPKKFTELSGPERFTHVRLIWEEANEFIFAAGATITDGGIAWPLVHMKTLSRSGVWTEHHKPPDYPEMIDTLGDLLYVVLGTAVSMGIDLEPFFDEIHRSNMAKLAPMGEPLVDDNGKVRKPPGWKPPDIAGLLEKLRAAGL